MTLIQARPNLFISQYDNLWFKYVDQIFQMFRFDEYASLYHQELTKQIIPFWENHSIDRDSGGYFTCLDQFGNVYDTDKFVWLQARQVWLFSMIYNQVQKNQKWLQIAIHGAEFLLDNGMNQQELWYFSVTRDGKPICEPYSIFSDCFAAMAFAELYKATQNDYYRELALKTYRSIERRQNNPKGKWSKSAGGRDIKSFSLPMIMCNLALCMEHVLGKQKVDEMVKPLIEQIMTHFLCKQHNILLENVGPNGQFVNCFEGRLVNAGHGNEAVWFLLDVAERFNDQALKEKLTDILIATTKFAWDQQNGGIFYFKDIKNCPLQHLEWDQKLWWVHIESMIAFLKAYRATGRQECLQWFTKLHQYTWNHFRDNKQAGEWWGYLNRQGEVLTPLKGGKWKGCFHVPRGLFQLWKTCQSLTNKKN